MARDRKHLPGDPKIAVAYLRVSTEDQSLGPEAQRGQIERWATAQGVTIAAWFVDQGVSGAAPLDKRPALQEALDGLREHNAGLLIVAKRDRLARDVLSAAMIERLAERSGAHVEAADGAGNGTGPEAELMRTMLDAFAQFERAIIRSRTKAALAVKRARGERVGGIPIGSTASKRSKLLLPADDERRAIDRILELHEEGLSLQAITDTLNGDGYPARGSRWHKTTVAHIVTRCEREASGS